jgi:mono/diheme cytochrome c family protein
MAASTPDAGAQPKGEARGRLLSAARLDRHGERTFEAQGCAECHGAGGIGTSKAPALTSLKESLTAAALTRVLEHPTHSMHSGGMPAVALTSAEMTGLVAYLRSLGTSNGSGLAVKSPAHAGNPAAGRQIYAKHCASCHGPTGEGNGTVGQALKLKPTDLASAPSDDVEWLRTIERGSKSAGKSDGMKGFAGELTAKQIRDVLAYAKTLGPSIRVQSRSRIMPGSPDAR